MFSKSKFLHVANVTGYAAGLFAGFGAMLFFFSLFSGSELTDAAAVVIAVAGLILAGAGSLVSLTSFLTINFLTK